MYQVTKTLMIIRLTSGTSERLQKYAILEQNIPMGHPCNEVRAHARVHTRNCAGVRDEHHYYHTDDLRAHVVVQRNHEPKRVNAAAHG